MDNLIRKLKVEYKDKKFLFIMDNLSSHKTAEVCKCLQDENTEV